MRGCVQAFECECMGACRQLSVHAWVRACISVRVHGYVHACISVCMCGCVHAFQYVYMGTSVVLVTILRLLVSNN